MLGNVVYITRKYLFIGASFKVVKANSLSIVVTCLINAHGLTFGQINKICVYPNLSDYNNI